MVMETTTPKLSSLRWRILREALLRRHSSNPSDQSQVGIKRISRKTTQGFNLIPCHLVNDDVEEDLDSESMSKLKRLRNSRDVCVCYTLPIERAPKLYLIQRVDSHVNLGDFEICNQYDIDNTGLVCHWPSEEVLAHFCLAHADMFRSKKVIELGSGYGLAGLVIAAVAEASEVMISDGNPKVVDYIQHNIEINSGEFGGTEVKSMELHWNNEEILNISNTFDVIVASDCTFFKEFHKGLVRTVKFLLKKTGPSEAIFFSPRRGDSLEKFLEEVKESGLHFGITENYDAEIWKRHQGFMNGDDFWPNYEKNHCYPLLAMANVPSLFTLLVGPGNTSTAHCLHYIVRSSLIMAFQLEREADNHWVGLI